jgi:polysaccharide deacetylase family protein (PEP-CTERM system associated)
MKLALTIDVEDWLNTTILQWTGRVLPPSAATLNDSLQLLALLAGERAKATWFFLGEVAEEFPQLARAVADAGHEVGVHGGMTHRALGSYSRAEFRESLLAAKATVEAASGTRVLGYRAPDFSLDRATWWVLDELREAGFRYDASIFPMRMPRYGMPRSPIRAHTVTTPSGAPFLEIPVTVWSWGALRFPFAGGGYLRQFPFRLVRAMTRSAARKGPVVFYMHPCEIQEHISVPPLPAGLGPAERTTILNRHHVESRGRTRGAEKLRRLMGEFSVASIHEVFADELRTAWPDLALGRQRLSAGEAGRG